MKESIAFAVLIASMLAFAFIVMAGLDKKFDSLCTDKDFARKHSDVCP